MRVQKLVWNRCGECDADSDLGTRAKHVQREILPQDGNLYWQEAAVPGCRFRDKGKMETSLRGGFVGTRVGAERPWRLRGPT